MAASRTRDQQAEPVDLRQVIVDRLEELGKSRYWLAAHPSFPGSSDAVYRYLRGEVDGLGESIGWMLSLLGLGVVVVHDEPVNRFPVKRRSSMRPHDKVIHDKYGYGIVEELLDLTVKVRWKKHRTRVGRDWSHVNRDSVRKV